MRNYISCDTLQHSGILLPASGKKIDIFHNFMYDACGKL